MTFDVKSICAIVACVSFLFGLLDKIKSLDKEVKTINKILFLDKGGLNVVNTEVCKDLREGIQKEISREADIAKNLLSK